jgi:hypothetical protein
MVHTRLPQTLTFNRLPHHGTKGRQGLYRDVEESQPRCDSFRNIPWFWIKLFIDISSENFSENLISGRA